LSGLGVSLLAALFVGQLYPSMVQRFQVVPNELAREAPHIDDNLDFTRLGFGLHELERGRYSARSSGVVDWSEASAQFQGLPVWSRSALLTTFREVEARFQYYDFPGVTIGRYAGPDGAVGPVALAVREVDPNRIEDPNWQNLHVRERYVVGNGAVAVDVTGRTPEGRPRSYLAGLPAVTSEDAPPALGLERDAVFFGTRDQPYALISATDSAYLAPDGAIGQAGVDFPVGIEVGGLVRKLMLSWYLRQANLLFAAGVGPDTRMVLRRGAVERASRIAPFLSFPEEPYAVIDEGRIVWVLEGMTVARFFPLARPFDLQRMGVSYVRNSAKVTVDAVTGEVAFYSVPGDDPLRDAYAEAFPGLFRPLESMPDGIRRHLRYSQSLLALQSSVLLSYHQETAATFFAGQDVWANPQEQAQGTSPVPYRPEYGLLRMPQDDATAFRLVTAFVPAGRQNLTALLSGELRDDGSPRLRLFDVPVENQVPGPRQVEALVEQDPEISQQFSLWRTGGSRVWTGHLHIVPVGDRVVYMEPVFLAAEEDAIPELRRFVVSDGQRVAMEETLAGAVSALAGRGPGADESVETVAPDPGDVTDLDALPREALDLLDAAEARLRAGDWAGFGDALERLRRLLRSDGGSTSQPGGSG
ncbi:MAG: COG1615 family transporter, partial [Gemmatimonadetes bacterium]|nr:COG1615 family transporter [Gemmatimonadota bacterium]